MARAAQAQSMADEVWFLPTGQSWQKPDNDTASPKIRGHLVELAIEGVHSWRIETIEIEHQGPSYTVDTLEKLTERHPSNQFIFVIGTDQLNNLTSWKHWESLFDYARIGVVDRIQHGEFNVPNALKRHLLQNRLFRIPMHSVNISSTEIRNAFSLLHSNNTEIAKTARHKLESNLPCAVFNYLMHQSVYGRTTP